VNWALGTTSPCCVFHVIHTVVYSSSLSQARRSGCRRDSATGIARTEGTGSGRMTGKMPVPLNSQNLGSKGRHRIYEMEYQEPFGWYPGSPPDPRPQLSCAAAAFLCPLRNFTHLPILDERLRFGFASREVRWIRARASGKSLTTRSVKGKNVSGTAVSWINAP
jgi:hypothetical protein